MRLSRSISGPAALLLGLAGSAVQAGELLHWQDNSLSYLYGRGFKINPGEQHTLTFEHANSWRYGYTFFFIDESLYAGTDDSLGRSSYYGEFAPRLSLGKVLGTPLRIGPVSDLLLALTYEFSEGDVEAYLIGPGFDLALPDFDYFQINFYRRFSEGPQAGNNVWQITPVWSYTQPFAGSDLLIDGYIDWVVDNDSNRHGSYQANLHFNPQLKYDLGKALGWQPRQLYAGLEYSYWKNKYGIKDDSALGELLGGSDQSSASLLLKAHF